VGLAGNRGNVLEISVVMKHDSTLVLGYGRSDQVDDTRCPVMSAGRHPDLDIPGPLSDYCRHRQDDIASSATLCDNPDVG
jgi:hypothetical protein